MSNPSSKIAARQNAIKAAKARAAAAQPTLTGLFADPTPAPEISASQARELMQAAPKLKAKTATPVASPVQTAPVAPQKTKVSVAAPVQDSPIATPVQAKVSAPEAKTEVVAPAKNVPVVVTAPATETAPATRVRASKVKVAAPVEAPVAARTEVAPVQDVPIAETEAAPPQKTVRVPKAVAAPVEAASVPVEATAPPKAVAKKVKRARVPENLAEQYGQSLSKRVEGGLEVVPVEDETPKKRRTRAETQARRELMKPDEDLIARLQRAQNAVPTRKAEKRPAGWRFDCGRCGHTSYFQTTGALCSCGALAIKE